MCVLCDMNIYTEADYRSEKDTLRFNYVMEVNFIETIREHCIKRNDEWAAQPLLRYSHEFCLSLNLPAAKAMYHHE